MEYFFQTYKVSDSPLWWIISGTSSPADWIHCSSRSSKTVWMVFWKIQYDYLAFFFSSHSSTSAALCSQFSVQCIFVSKTIKVQQNESGIWLYVLIKFLHRKLVVVKILLWYWSAKVQFSSKNMQNAFPSNSNKVHTYDCQSYCRGWRRKVQKKRRREN